MELNHRIRLKRALRLICLDYEQSAKESVTPENISVVQALILRLDAMRESVKIKADTGSKKHIWLSPAQVQEITSLCGSDLEGKRDWIILALLLGTGMRRAELLKITFAALQKKQTKSGEEHDVLQVAKSNGKSREVPISPVLAERLREWEKIVGEGFIARSYCGKNLGESISSVAVHQVVRKY